MMEILSLHDVLSKKWNAIGTLYPEGKDINSEKDWSCKNYGIFIR